MLIGIQDDFDPVRIEKSGQCFRAQTKENGAVRFITGKSVLHVKSAGQHRFDVSCERDEWDRVWHPYFDLSFCCRGAREALPEGFFKTAAAEGAGIRILRQEPFETLVSFIISQRKSIPAIRGAVETLCRRFGERIEGEALFAFPSPAALANASESELAACGLGYRRPYVEDAAKRVYTGETDLSALCALDDAALTAALMRIKGVGIKVAGCTALFAYARKGIAPVDTWINKIIEQKYSGREPFSAFGNIAGLLQQYAFFYAQNHKEEFR